MTRTGRPCASCLELLREHWRCARREELVRRRRSRRSRDLWTEPRKGLGGVVGVITGPQAWRPSDTPRPEIVEALTEDELAEAMSGRPLDIDYIEATSEEDR